MEDDRIYVVQTIADGAQGYPYDEVLAIGVCAVDLETGDFDSVYDAVLQIEPKYIGKPKLDYAEANGLDVSMLYTGVPEAQAAKEFKEVIRGKYVTSYDIRQEFGKYLTNNPWDITLEAHVMPSISTRQPISFRCKDPEDEPAIIVKAYRKMFRKDDPANVGRKRGALELAQMASCIMINLRERGKY